MFDSVAVKKLLDIRKLFRQFFWSLFSAGFIITVFFSPKSLLASIKRNQDFIRIYVIQNFVEHSFK